MFKIDNIIVEGADQQGKTQLCEKISKLTGWPIVHFGPPDESFNFHSDYLVEKHIISDRNFLSEMVYSQIRNQGHRVKDLNMLQYYMLQRNYLMIHVDREEFFVFEDREEKFSEEEIQKARLLYKQVFGHVIFNKITINPNTDEHLITKLIKDAGIQIS